VENGPEPLSVQYPRHPAVSSAARRTAQRWCADAGYSETVAEDVALVVSELVTNALVHGRGQISLDVVAEGNDIEIQVQDQMREGPPVVAAMPDLLAAYGRGWLLTQAIASATGVSNTLHGKTVWARISAVRTR
jgi:anti-sigma regulatory factor (Ser/Thr protein kinase)